MTLPNQPSLIEYEGYHFLVFETPNDSNLPLYLNEFKKHNVKHIVRVCDPTYATSLLDENGIAVHDWPFPDGGAPPSDIISRWRGLVKEVFSNATEKETIGIHCVAGLGRAPLLVALALIEAGMDNLAAIDYVRSKRRGSINQNQLKFLTSYKPSKGCILS